MVRHVAIVVMWGQHAIGQVKDAVSLKQNSDGRQGEGGSD